jgi:hypothetical protein
VTYEHTKFEARRKRWSLVSWITSGVALVLLVGSALFDSPPVLRLALLLTIGVGASLGHLLWRFSDPVYDSKRQPEVEDDQG